MAEKEYIERDSIYSRVKRHTNPYGKPTLDYESGIKVLDMIKQEPAADVVEVVRCKECKYWRHEEDLDFVCDRHYGYRTSMDFCSNGVRKEQQ